MPDEPPRPSSAEPTTFQLPALSSAGSFDRYRLLQRLGEGGMGEVWLAEQIEPVHRQVALKVIKAGMDSVQVIAMGKENGSFFSSKPNAGRSQKRRRRLKGSLS